MNGRSSPSTFSAREYNAALLILMTIAAVAVIVFMKGGVWRFAGPVIGVVVIWSVLTKPKGTILTVTSEGFRDRRLGNKQIPWRYVEQLDRINLHGTHYINVRLNSSGDEFVELAGWRRIINPLLRLVGVMPVHVTASGLNAHPDDVFSEMMRAYTERSSTTA